MAPPDFQTQYLSVCHWAPQLADATARPGLESMLAPLLTSTVLAPLPASFAMTGSISDWIDQRQEESDVYTVTRTDDGILVGLLITVQPADTLHIGYLLGQAHWGQGYASALIQGLCQALAGGATRHVSAGVAPGNPASAQVLRKAGFTALASKPKDEMLTFVRSV